MAMQLKINTLVAVDFFEIIRVYLNQPAHRKKEGTKQRKDASVLLNPIQTGWGFLGPPPPSPLGNNNF